MLNERLTKLNFRPKYVNNAKNQNQFADRWLKSKNWACYLFTCSGVRWRWAGVWYLWVDVLRYWCAFVCYFLFIGYLLMNGIATFTSIMWIFVICNCWTYSVNNFHIYVKYFWFRFVTIELKVKLTMMRYFFYGFDGKKKCSK